MWSNFSRFLWFFLGFLRGFTLPFTFPEFCMAEIMWYSHLSAAQLPRIPVLTPDDRASFPVSTLTPPAPFVEPLAGEQNADPVADREEHRRAVSKYENLRTRELIRHCVLAGLMEEPPSRIPISTTGIADVSRALSAVPPVSPAVATVAPSTSYADITSLSVVTAGFSAGDTDVEAGAVADSVGEDFPPLCGGASANPSPFSSASTESESGEHCPSFPFSFFPVFISIVLRHFFFLVAHHEVRCGSGNRDSYFGGEYLGTSSDDLRSLNGEIETHLLEGYEGSSCFYIPINVSRTRTSAFVCNKFSYCRVHFRWTAGEKSTPFQSAGLSFNRQSTRRPS